ncbi:MAG: DUF1638 domain-containing protein [Desulfopila sp.]|nr:DUF1638 domain-containing protein [Desulfopila sp.]
MIIACSALKSQLDKILDNLDHKVTVKYLEAGLHLRPQLLQKELSRTIKSASKNSQDIKVVYGKCCPDIDEVCNRYGARRTKIENCYELYLGDRYSSLIQEEPGTYFLDAFLATNFTELVIKQLAMDRNPKLKSMFFSHYKRLVYIDITGAGLTAEAKFVAEFLELPVKPITVDPQRLQLCLNKIL